MRRNDYYDAFLYAETYLDNAFAGNGTDIVEYDDDDDSNNDNRIDTIDVLKRISNLANIMDKEA